MTNTRKQQQIAEKFNFCFSPYTTELEDSIYATFKHNHVVYSTLPFNEVYAQGSTVHTAFEARQKDMYTIIEKYRPRRYQVPDKRFRLNPKERTILIQYKIASIMAAYCQYRYIYEHLRQVIRENKTLTSKVIREEFGSALRDNSNILKINYLCQSASVIRELNSILSKNGDTYIRGCSNCSLKTHAWVSTCYENCKWEEACEKNDAHTLVSLALEGIHGCIKAFNYCTVLLKSTKNAIRHVRAKKSRGK